MRGKSLSSEDAHSSFANRLAVAPVEFLASTKKKPKPAYFYAIYACFDIFLPEFFLDIFYRSFQKPQPVMSPKPFVAVATANEFLF